jgi:hypothetical protein
VPIADDIQDQNTQVCYILAKGSPVAPILADLWMQKMEDKLNKFSKNKPILWLRYVDDVYCLFDIPEKKMIEFHSRINKWHSNLHFTIEHESNNSLAFLDVLVTQDKGQLITSLYRKPSHTGLYLLWDSCQNRRYKIGLIKTLVVRIHRICSTQEIIDKEINLLKETLQMNGCPPHIIRRGISEGKVVVQRQIQTTTTTTNKDTNNIYFTVAYYGQESMIFAARIKRICKKLIPNQRIQFAFKKHLSLKRIFLQILKGKDESKTKKKLVYSIPCKDCNKVYIGETARMKEVRMIEHQAKIKSLASDSKLVEHIQQYKHEFDFWKTTTLAHDTEWRKRIIKESLLTYKTNGNAINDTKHTLHIFG